MVWKVVTLVNLLWWACVVTARPSQPSHATSEQKFIKYFNKHEEKIIARTGSEGAGDHEEYADTYPSYEFSYKIMDPYTHDIKGQNEKRHGDKVNGDYWLIEPDGRKRIVKYHANDKIGFKVLIDYLKKEGLHVISNKEQKKAKEVEEKKVEEAPAIEPEPESVNNQSEEKKVQEEAKTNESQEKETPKSELVEEKEESKKNDEKEAEQQTRGESKSAVKITKVIKPRLIIRIINEDNAEVANNQKEKPRESEILKERNMINFHVRKDWSMKKEKPKENKQEEKNKKENLQERRNEWNSRSKGYEVVEEVIENDSEINNVDSEIKQPIVENIVAEVSKDEVKKIENEKDDKINNSENEEEVYGYNTFIYHPHH